jgi:hypothetical protein
MDNDLKSPSQVVAEKRENFQQTGGKIGTVLEYAASKIPHFGNKMVAVSILMGINVGTAFYQTDPEKIKMNFND